MRQGENHQAVTYEKFQLNQGMQAVQSCLSRHIGQPRQKTFEVDGITWPAVFLQSPHSDHDPIIAPLTASGAKQLWGRYSSLPLRAAIKRPLLLGHQDQATILKQHPLAAAFHNRRFMADHNGYTPALRCSLIAPNRCSSRSMSCPGGSSNSKMGGWARTDMRCRFFSPRPEQRAPAPDRKRSNLSRSCSTFSNSAPDLRLKNGSAVWL